MDSIQGITFDPIWPAPAESRGFWTVVAILWLVALSLWAYFGVWGAPDRRRKLILALRLVAVALVGLAMLRPTIVFAERTKQQAAIVILGDRSRSMLIEDGPGDQSRWKMLVQTLSDSDGELKALARQYQILRHGFGEELADDLDLSAEPDAQQTALGAGLQDAYQRHAHQRLAAILLLSDGAQRALRPRDLPAQSAARFLADRRVPVYSVGFGQASLTGEVQDVAVRDVQAPRSIFVKNTLEASAEISQRGFPDRPISVRLHVEDAAGRTTLAETAPEMRSREDEQLMPARLRWTPTLPGEYKLTVEAVPLRGEIITRNNTFSTFVTVQKGGLSVLYLEGTIRPEPKFIGRALDESADIRVDRRVLFQPGSSQVRSEWFEPGQYDVFILGNLDADRLSRDHWQALREAVDRGAGLIMIGGEHSFGPGGHARTPLADVLPVRMSRLERQREGPLQMVPTPIGLRYVMRLSGPGDDQSAWQELRPLDGANRIDADSLKPGAQVLAQSQNNDPLLVAWELAPARVMAFAGDTTWHWVMDGHGASHIRFWRQVVLWLAHKDEQNQGNVALELDRRRYRLGQKVELTASVTDADGNSIPDATFEVKVEAPEERIDEVTLRGGAAGTARGSYFDTDRSGDYRVRLIARQGENILGSAQARFLVYEEDLEWDNPANLALLQSISNQTRGEYIPPEELPAFLRAFRDRPQSNYLRPRELTLWDRWPFFLLFVGVLTAEWFLRKRAGLA